MKLRNPWLDGLKQSHGHSPKYYDPEGKKYGRPTFPYHMAPAGLSTRRQLRAKGLCPGGHEPVAQILWDHKGPTRRVNGQRKAFLYDESKARSKRVATPAVKSALAQAELARHTCKSCDGIKDYEISRSRGECNDCYEVALERARQATAEPAPEPVTWLPPKARERQPEPELEAAG